MGKFVELAQKAGRWGVFGLFCFLLQGVAIFVKSAPQWHNFWDFVGSLGDLAGSFGIGLTLIGVLGGVKRGNDMTATIGAESKIDRASIATGLPNAPVIEVVPQSADPAVQREITKQLNGKQVVMDEGRARVAASRSGSGD
jgi:hypothetical protein